MKSLQWWQKVGLVRVTFRKQCPGALTEYRAFEPGDCCAFFLPGPGLELGLSIFTRPLSAIPVGSNGKSSAKRQEKILHEIGCCESHICDLAVMLNPNESSLIKVNVSSLPLQCIRVGNALQLNQCNRMSKRSKARVSYCESFTIWPPNQTSNSLNMPVCLYRRQPAVCKCMRENKATASTYMMRWGFNRHKTPAAYHLRLFSLSQQRRFSPTQATVT